MELKEVVKVFENFAPKKLAESWDNIGLLIEPSDLYVSKIMLTNDLTLKVEFFFTKKKFINEFY